MDNVMNFTFKHPDIIRRFFENGNQEEFERLNQLQFDKINNLATLARYTFMETHRQIHENEDETPHEMIQLPIFDKMTCSQHFMMTANVSQAITEGTYSVIKNKFTELLNLTDEEFDQEFKILFNAQFFIVPNQLSDEVIFALEKDDESVPIYNLLLSHCVFKVKDRISSFNVVELPDNYSENIPPACNIEGYYIRPNEDSINIGTFKKVDPTDEFYPFTDRVWLSIRDGVVKGIVDTFKGDNVITDEDGYLTLDKDFISSVKPETLDNIQLSGILPNHYFDHLDRSVLEEAKIHVRADMDSVSLFNHYPYYKLTHLSIIQHHRAMMVTRMVQISKNSIQEVEIIQGQPVVNELNHQLKVN